MGVTVEKRPTAATRALAAGRMVAGFTPDDRPTPNENRKAPAPAPRLGRPTSGFQLREWADFDRARARERAEVTNANKARRRDSWGAWLRSWIPVDRGPGKERRLPRADRLLLCREYGVTYSGRQWRKLRRGILRGVKVATMLERLERERRHARDIGSVGG